MVERENAGAILMNTRIKMIAIIGAATTLSWQALAQQDVPATPLAPPDANQLPISITLPVQPVPVEKVIDPALNDAIPAPLPQWDGEKPFMPELHTPQFPAPTLANEMLDAFQPAAKLAFDLRETSVQELRMVDQPQEKLIAVSLPDGERVVRVRPYTMRSPDAKLMVQIEGGFIVEHPWPEPATYRGTIDGMDADVAASIQDGDVSMLILPRDPAQPTWHMQPLSDALPGMPPSLHVVYKSTDVLPRNATCGVDDRMMPIPVGQQPAPQHPPLAVRLQQQMPLNAQPAPVTKPDDAGQFDGGGGGGSADDEGGIAVANVRCQLGLDADVEFYQANGSSVLLTVYDMELIMNQVGLIYQNQVAISYTHNVTFVRTAEPDPYTSTNANTLLCQFGEWWNINVTATRDVAQLFTGKDLDGTTVGLAWIGSICPTNFNNCNAAGSNLSYGLVQSRFATDLASRTQDSAHELGHNWNGCHCNTGGNCGGGTSNPVCGIMTSAISGQLTFDAAAVTAITAYRDTRTCLEAWFNPVYVNWSWGGAETGSISNPFNTIFEGIDATLVNGTLIVQGGNYLQNPNIFKAKTIQAVNGTVRIGN